MPKYSLDIANQQFGQLKVLGRAESSDKYHPKWRCICSCGGIINADIYHLLSGHTTSCGKCIKTHGEARDGKWSTEYRMWHHIKDRCFNSNDKKYKDYGGRGITMYGPWKSSYEVFRDYLISTIGRRPSKEYSIDRINNNSGYFPGNIRWATIYEQNRNQRGRNPDYAKT